MNDCEEPSRAAGRRTLGDRLSRRLWLLESEALCAEARRAIGLEDFGAPLIEPALSILVSSLELEAHLHPLGRFFMRVILRELLETRLRLAQACSERLEALEASLIQRPVFITGMWRSGSTFLHELLAEDPENRVPRVWEVMFPVAVHSGVRKRSGSAGSEGRGLFVVVPPARPWSGFGLPDACLDAARMRGDPQLHAVV